MGLGLSTDQIEGFLNCVLKNKEAFCQQILPIYETKIKEIDDQIKLFSMHRFNLEERVKSIKTSRK
jgi:hypothetical protein